MAIGPLFFYDWLITVTSVCYNNIYFLRVPFYVFLEKTAVTVTADNVKGGEKT